MAGFSRVAASEDFDPNVAVGAPPSADAVASTSDTSGETESDNKPPQEELRGTVDRVMHRSKDDRFAVLRVKVRAGRGFKKHIVAGAVSKGLVYSTGDEIEATGTWGQHDKYGEQFKATRVRILTQEVRRLAGVRRFYQKYRERLPDVGGQTINALIAHFGDDLPEKMGDREALSKVIATAKAATISDLWNHIMNDQAEKDTMQIMELGVNARAATAIVDEWGVGALKRFKESPWSAMSIKGVGFGSAEAAGRSLGLPTDHKDRIEALLDITLQETEETDGHIALPVIDLANRAIKIAKQADASGAVDLQVTIIRQLPELIKTKKLKALVKEDGPLIMRPITHAAMVSIVRSLAFAYANPITTPHPILEERFKQAVETVRQQGVPLNPKQQRITWNALTQRISNAIGFAGSGKTTSMSAVFKAFSGTNFVVSSLAGKAVVRARETAGAKGYTMHSLLHWVPNRWWVPRLGMHVSDGELERAKDDGTIPGVDFDDPEMVPVARGPGFLHDQFRRLNQDFIALDESSMPSVILMAQFLRAVDFRRTQVVLAGDTAQLLIGPGKTFADIIDTNLLPTSQLDEVYRQKAEDLEEGAEPSVLPDALLHIREGEFPVTGEGHDFLERNDKEILSTVVEEARRWNGEGRWNGSTLVMAPMRPGKCGISAINRALKTEFNPAKGEVEPTNIESWRLFYTTRDGQELEITKGDPVIQANNEPLPIITSALARNGALPETISVRKPAKDKDERTMNGTIGLFLGFRFVPEDPSDQSAIKGWVATFKFEQENEFIAAPVEMDERRFGMFRISSLEMGFAMSPYKAQGSEAKYALCVYPAEATGTMNRNMLYTAASRGKVWATEIGQRSAYERALKIVEAENRISPLKDFILEHIEKFPEVEMPELESFLDEAKDSAMTKSISASHGISFQEDSDQTQQNLKRLTSNLVDLSERSQMTTQEWMQASELRKIEIQRDIRSRADAFGLVLDTSNETIHEYSERLRTHDWTYEFSDDAGTFRRGSENYNRILELKNIVGQDIAYLGWVTHAPHHFITRYPQAAIPAWAYTDYSEATPNTEPADEPQSDIIGAEPASDPDLEYDIPF